MKKFKINKIVIAFSIVLMYNEFNWDCDIAQRRFIERER